MKKKTILVAVTAAVAMMGCSVLPDRTSTSFSLDKRAEETVRRVEPSADNPPVSPAEETIEAGYREEEGFILKSMQESDPLPAGKVMNIKNFNERSAMDSLRLMLADTGINLVYTGTTEGNSKLYGSVNGINITGTLPQIVDRLSDALGFFYTYRNGVLKVSNDQSFILTLPPAVKEDTYTGMLNTIQSLGGFGANLDKINKTLLFRADQRAYHLIQQYFEFMRETRSMVVYDINIYQVGFNRDSQTGVSWSDLNNFFLKNGLGALTLSSDKVTMPGSVGLSTTYRTNRFDAGVFANFLSTQGKLKIISQPKISMMSGSRSQLQQGNSTRYVSEVGSNLSVSLNTISVKTDVVLSGLSMSISSDYHDNTVYTRINLSLSDLIKFNNFTALGTNLNLPQTSTRDISTELRSKPGDTILIGGISSSETHEDLAGMPLFGGLSLPTTLGSKDNKTELVLVMTPRVIKFVGEKRAKPVAAPLAVKPAEPVAAAVPVPVLAAPVVKMDLKADAENKTTRKNKTSGKVKKTVVAVSPEQPPAKTEDGAAYTVVTALPAPLAPAPIKMDAVVSVTPPVVPAAAKVAEPAVELPLALKKTDEMAKPATVEKNAMAVIVPPPVMKPVILSPVVEVKPPVQPMVPAVAEIIPPVKPVSVLAPLLPVLQFKPASAPVSNAIMVAPSSRAPTDSQRSFWLF